MAITALPTPPNRNMTPEQFIAAADAFLEALTTFQEEANAAAEAMNLNDTSGTSATSNSIGTGAKTFTANTGKSWLPGMFIVIADTAAPSTNSMIAQVTSYDSGTGALVVDVKGTLGSGTKTAWTISQTTNPIPLDLSVTTGKLAEAVFNSLTTVTPALTDFMSGADTSDSGNKKKFLLEAIRDLFAPRGYIAGLTMSTAGSSATMTIAAGEAKDAGNAALMQLAAAISKTTSAWAVCSGNGGLDTGAIANSTWYHFYLIRRPDSGVVDVVFSTNASVPTLPANYTQYRRIGSARTNGSAQWTKFVQLGDEFLWDAAVVDVDAVNPGTSAVSRTLSTPLGIQTLAMLTVGGYNGTSAFGINVSSLDASDQAPQAATTAALTGFSSGNGPIGSTYWNFTNQTVRTNTSSQVRSRLSASGAADRVGIITRGWIDDRGRNA